MAVTLVTTMGSKSANSFCTVAEADVYIAASLWSESEQSGWDALTDAQKTQLLYLAGLLMRGMSWAHWPVYDKQAMPFPRCYYEYVPERLRNWYPYDSTSIIYVGDDDSAANIPDAIKQAQTYIAYDVVWRGLQSRTEPSDGVAGEAIERLSLFGDISIGFSKGEVALSNGSAWEEIIRREHWEIDLLISPYQTTIEFISANDRVQPELEDEVA